MMTVHCHEQRLARVLVAVGLALLGAPALGQAAAKPEPVARPEAAAGDASADVALQLANPVASLISVPIQTNFDGGIGPDREGGRITANIQPVIPFALGKDWSVVSRTITPVVWQQDIARVNGQPTGTQFGLGDTVQSLFLSPARPRGVIWGVGPVLLVPTGTDPLLSTGKWGAGPTGVVLKQSGPMTYGVLANHIWSFAGNSARNDVSQSFANPFVTHTSKSAFTYGLVADITYDWNRDAWTAPVSLVASQVTRIGGQLVSIGGALRYYVVSNDQAPHGFAGRFTVTLLFPRR
jgi:hypothetical protein